MHNTSVLYRIEVSYIVAESAYFSTERDYQKHIDDRSAIIV